MTVLVTLHDAVRCLVQLAGATERARGASEIAHAEGLDPESVRSVLDRLCAASLVSRVSGAMDGYRLSRAAERIRIGDVRRALGGDGARAAPALVGFSLADLVAQESRLFERSGPALAA